MRMFGFYGSAKECRIAKDLPYTRPPMAPEDADKPLAIPTGSFWGNRPCGTYIGRTLAQIKAIRPAKTVVISDGGTADRRQMLGIASGMGCSIDGIYPVPEKYLYDDLSINIMGWSEDQMYNYLTASNSEKNMRELASAGRGNYYRWQPFHHDIEAILRKCFGQPLTGYQQRIIAPSARIILK